MYFVNKQIINYLDLSFINPLGKNAICLCVVDFDKKITKCKKNYCLGFDSLETTEEKTIVSPGEKLMVLYDKNKKSFIVGNE